MTQVLHFVCDRCGNYWQALQPRECPECDAERVWEFDRAQPAREHAAHVRRIAKGHLFREAKP